MERTRKAISLRVASWNNTSATKRKHELGDFAVRCQLDLIVLQETRLGVRDNHFLEGISSYRTDRNRRGEGTAILIRPTLKYVQLPVPADLQGDAIVATAIEVETSNYGILLTFSVHLRHSPKVMEAEVEALMLARKQSILSGDLNSKHPDLEHQDQQCEQQPTDALD